MRHRLGVRSATLALAFGAIGCSGELVTPPERGELPVLEQKVAGDHKFADLKDVRVPSVLASVNTTYSVSSIPFAPVTDFLGNLGPTCDDCVQLGVPIGFSFEFFGNTYTTLDLSSNGFVRLGVAANRSWNGCCRGSNIPEDEGYALGGLNNLIAVAWTDLLPQYPGMIRWATVGSAPNRRFVVHYIDVPEYSGTNPFVNAQIILYERSNVIEIHTAYLRAASQAYHVTTQGIENATGTEAAFMAGRVQALFTLTKDAIRFSSGPVDDTPPVIAPRIEGTLGENGWYVSDVSVGWTVSDAESAVTATDGCGNDLLTGDTQGITFTCSATSAGGTGSRSVTIKRDATAPAVNYLGNSTTYSVDQNVAITCASTDEMSGVASDTCANVTGPAYSFALGRNMFSAEATDNAGNRGSGGISFEVVVTAESLCNLTERFVTHEGTANSLCTKLRNAASARARGQSRAARQMLEAYVNEVEAQTGKHVPTDEAGVLVSLATALMD